MTKYYGGTRYSSRNSGQEPSRMRVEPDALDPRQKQFTNLYFEPTSPYFGNCYQAAIRSGYSHATAKNMTVNPPKWLLEKGGNISVTQKEVLLERLWEVIETSESTRDRLRAIELMMKYNNMLNEQKLQLQAQTVNIETALSELV